MAYTPKTDWKTGETLPANDMNRIEQGIADASISATWSGVTGKPTTYTPTIGTTATTAAAGNHAHAFSAITGTATAAQIPSLAASKITSGTFDVARIPTGTTATTVALGNHTHAGLVTTTAAPTITITDPPDDENIQAAFNTLIAALKTAGVLT